MTPPPPFSTMTSTPQDFLVQGLEHVIPAYAKFKGEMYAGLIPMDNGNRHGNTMFWLFEPTSQLVPDSLVIWLNGGPGCSSFNCGVLMEHSPVTQPLHEAGYCCLEDSQPHFDYNEHTWTRATTMLYVEHPLGTGFSYGDPLPENELEASGDLDAFLQNLLGVFSHLLEYKVYIMGESYAGMFVPTVGRYIHRANKKALKDPASNTRKHVNLQGLALGNGWIEPKTQGPATIDYSWWHGLIDKPTRDALHVEWRNCMDNYKKEHRHFAKVGTLEKEGPQPPPFHPFNVQDDCGIMWGILASAGNPNAYDITTWDPNVDQVTFSSEWFYNTAAVKKALHAPHNITWHGCRVGAGRRRLFDSGGHRRLYMDNDRPLSVVPYISELLDEGIPILVYNGDRDMTTNMVGTELALNDMEWSGKDRWLDAKRGLWMVENYPAGWAKELGSLSFVVVYNSGHMVPYNRPSPSFDLLLRFLRNKPFVDTETPTLRVQKEHATGEVQPSLLHESVASMSSNKAALFPTLELTQHVRWETAVGMAIVSMVVGAMLAMGLAKYSQRTARRSYEPIGGTEELS